MSDGLIGKKLGGYQILDKLGQGGMATVYRANQTSMNRVVALKVLPRHFMQDAAYLQRFEREVKIVAQLEHRNIIPVYDYGEHDNQPFIAMRHMPAGSVEDLLNRRSILTLETTLNIIQQIAPALDYAHTKNVLHRDLKPSNILLDDEGGAYITDFGIARILGAEGKGATITTQGVVGTPSYMSPEQAQGKDLDGRSDIYSLGVMLFEMLTGRRPFQSETPYGVAVMQVTTQPPSPRNINPSISSAVEHVILKALKKQPENRYPTATALADALQIAINSTDGLHDTQPKRPAPFIQVTQESAVAGAQIQNPPLPPRVNYTATGQAQQHIPPTSQSLSHPMRRIKKRSNNLWLSIIIGAFIGCAFLSVVMIGGAYMLGDWLSDDDIPIFPTQNRAVVGGNVDTPVFSNATPIPTRTPFNTPSGAIVNEPPVFSGDFDPASNAIIYFSWQDEQYNIFHLDLSNGLESRLTYVEGATFSYPLVSPDGQHLVFQSDSDGDFEIYVMDLNTKDTLQLTDNTVLDRIPSWSADGRWIIYSSDTREDGTLDLYRVAVDGSDAPQLVYTDGKRNSHPRYSHDGDYLVFTSGESGNAATWEIIKLNLNTGETMQLTHNTVRDASPQFSPDDGQILYTTYGDGGAAIAVMDANSGDSTVLYDDPGFEWGMDYSPNGDYIVFNSQDADVSTLYVMQIDGSGITRIETISGGFYPSWVP